MGKDTLLDYINKKNEKLREEKFDVEKEKKEWLNELKILFEKIERFLSEIGTEKIEYEMNEINLNEEFFHSYQVQKMDLMISDVQVSIKPIARFVIGAAGRVDIIGPNATAKLVLVSEGAKEPEFKVDENIPNEAMETEKGPAKKRNWKIVSTKPKIHYVELNVDTFSDVLLEIIGV
ncbi:MAG: hypothetical protein U9N62_10175 [Thermotogota bacterium]|nr:hypothetical protein [Thermotogota bacterium]